MASIPPRGGTHSDEEPPEEEQVGLEDSPHEESHAQPSTAADDGDEGVAEGQHEAPDHAPDPAAAVEASAMAETELDTDGAPDAGAEGQLTRDEQPIPEDPQTQ